MNDRMKILSTILTVSVGANIFLILTIRNKDKLRKATIGDAWRNINYLADRLDEEAYEAWAMKVRTDVLFYQAIGKDDPLNW